MSGPPFTPHPRGGQQRSPLTPLRPAACLALWLPRDPQPHALPLSSAYKKYVRETYAKQAKSQET